MPTLPPNISHILSGLVAAVLGVAMAFGYQVTDFAGTYSTDLNAVTIIVAAAWNIYGHFKKPAHKVGAHD